MKSKVRIPLLILFLLAIVKDSYGQSKIDIEGGIIATNHHEKDIDFIRLGWTVGAMKKFVISKHFSLNTGVLYSKERFYYYQEVYNTNLLLHNLNVPVLISYHFAKRISLLIGPKLSYLIAAQVKDEIGQKTDVTKSYERLNESIAFGAGFRIGQKFQLKLEYDHGLKSIGERPFFGPFYNRHMELRLSYQIK